MYWEFMSMLELLKSTRNGIQLISIKRESILIIKGTILYMEELVGEVEDSQRKWYTS